MQMPKVPLEIIEDFLAQKRLAMIGVSRNPKDFSAVLFEELRKRGYEVIPVNPNATEVLCQHCFARIQDVKPPVDTVLLMTPSRSTDAVVSDCAEAGIKRIWMYRAGGKGAVSPRAVAFCHERGIRVVPGQCPYMFLPGSGGVHAFHGFIRKITGRYPKHQHAA
jgi:hypothetical protein